MMNKNILFVLPLGWFLVGCAAQTMPGSPGVPDTVACESYKGASNGCGEPEPHPLVTVDLDTMTVKPECVTANRGAVIRFVLESTSTIAQGSVEVFPKLSVNEWWLAGKNTPNKKHILVLIPQKNENGSDFEPGEYEYGIRTPSACIDPRVNVQN